VKLQFSRKKQPFFSILSTLAEREESDDSKDILNGSRGFATFVQMRGAFASDSAAIYHGCHYALYSFKSTSSSKIGINGFVNDCRISMFLK